MEEIDLKRLPSADELYGGAGFISQLDLVQTHTKATKSPWQQQKGGLARTT